MHSDAYKQMAQELDEFGHDVLLLVQLDTAMPLSPMATVRYAVVHAAHSGLSSEFVVQEVHALFGGDEHIDWNLSRIVWRGTARKHVLQTDAMQDAIRRVGRVNV